MDAPHRRFNLLNGDWVLVSPHRTQRPWQGQNEDQPQDNRPAYDPTCYLCPGNTRANGQTNPAYTEPFVFQNDFAALLPDAQAETSQDELFQTQSLQGECRVICYSPRHDLTLAQMPEDQIEAVIRCWQTQYQELSTKYKWVQIFENKGAIMGCSNPHPHGQIWAQSELPNEATNESKQQQNYFAKHQRQLLIDVAHQELEKQTRVVASNDEWVAVVPFWAVWPFETLLMPLQQKMTILEADSKPLASILKDLLQKYDRLFGVSMPFSMGWHNAPGNQESWTLHAHFYPPLLRSATVKKFMVGYEMLSEPQRDLTPEAAAERLRLA